MKWIKLSEKRPNSPTKFTVRKKDGTVFQTEWFLNMFNNGDPDIIEWLDESPEPSPTVVGSEFSDHIKATRNRFCNYINSKEWDIELRTECENLLIAYDQLAAASPVGGDAVEFAEWAGLNYTQIENSVWYECREGLDSNRPRYTTAELYQLFIKSKTV